MLHFLVNALADIFFGPPLWQEPPRVIAAYGVGYALAFLLVLWRLRANRSPLADFMRADRAYRERPPTPDLHGLKKPRGPSGRHFRHSPSEG